MSFIVSKAEQRATRNSMILEDEEEEEMLLLGLTVLVKKRLEIPDDLYQDLKYIFHISYLKTLDDADKKSAARRSVFFPGDKALNQFEQKLELPRRLPSNHDLRNNVALFFEISGTSSVLVFLIHWCQETKDIFMFHVVTKRFAKMYSDLSCGVAAIGERLYFVGGCYRDDHDVIYRYNTTFRRLKSEKIKANKNKSKKKKKKTLEDIRRVDYDMESLWRKAMDKVHSTPPERLNVPTYNLRAKRWESSTPHLNGPKPNPVVFVYHGKIFALRGRHDYELPKDSPVFEFMDTKCPIGTSPRWTELPAPPFDMQDYMYHIFDEENGVLLLFFKSQPGAYLRDDPLSCCQLSLKENPFELEWTHIENDDMSRDSIGPDYSVGLSLRHISDEHSRSCIVDGIIFSYDFNYKSGKPVILGQYMGCDKSSFGPWEIDGLDEVLAGKVDTPTSFGFLNHIGNHRFCLIIKYYAGFPTRTSAIYSLIFDLVKKELPNEYRTIMCRDESKTQKASKFEFVFKPVCGRAFQVPNHVLLRFCKNL